MNKQKYYAVDFETYNGYETEIFEDLKEANKFGDMVANINEKAFICLYEVEKISIHNKDYYITRKTLRQRKV